jgi:hypothetical protein
MSTASTSTSSIPHRKVVAGTAGSALGVAVGSIILEIIDSLNGEAAVPDRLQTAVPVLAAALISFIAAYLTPPGVQAP